MRALTRTAGLLTVILAMPLPTPVRDLGLDSARAGVGPSPERSGDLERQDPAEAGQVGKPRSLRALRPFRSPGPSLDIRLRLRTLLMAGLAVLAASAAMPWSTPAQAAPRLRCEGARAYAGPPLLASPPPANLPVRAALDGTLDPAATARLDAAFDTAFTATKAHAMTAAVAVPGRGAWTRTRGGDQPLFYWASAGKQATAVVVLQLVEEGKLKLSDPVSRWVAGVPNGDAVTVEHLLSHTGGLFSANEDPDLRRKGGRVSPDQDLAIVRRHGPQSCPGEAWRYSNSGYILLGRIVEKVDGRPLAQAITARIIAPLGLTRMRVVGAGDAGAGDVAPPVSDGPDPAIDITVPGAAGPLVASAPDMIRFQQAMLDGELLKPETTALALRRLYPMFGGDTYYGLGVMVYDVPDPPGRLDWIGHSGGAPGVRAIVAYAPGRRAFVAVALTGDGAAHAAANLLLKAAGP